MAEIQKEVFSNLNKYYKALEPVIDKPKNRTYTAIILTFLAISLFGWYAIKPTIQTIIVLRKEIAEKEELNKKMEDKITNLIEAQEAYMAAQPLFYLIDEAIPSDPEAVDLMLQIDNLVNTTDATLSAFSLASVPLVVQKNTDATPQKEFIINTGSQGAYPDIEALLDQLILMRRLVSIQSIAFEPEYARNTSVATGSATATGMEVRTGIKGFYFPNL